MENTRRSSICQEDERERHAKIDLNCNSFFAIAVSIHRFGEAATRTFRRRFEGHRGRGSHLQGGADFHRAESRLAAILSRLHAAH